jgi:hypothetical protein
MDKKPLIGVSICAVVLLVLGSLTNVVGYQSVKSTAVNDSSLFRTRTQRAINQQQDIITSQYLGKGKGNLLQFPTRDNRTELLIKAIDFISKMDDKTFTLLTALCIQRARQVDTLSNTNPNEIKLMLQLLRTQPEIITHSLTNRNNHGNITYIDTIYPWIPGCLLLLIFFLIVMFITGWTSQMFCGWTSQMICPT